MTPLKLWGIHEAIKRRELHLDSRIIIDSMHICVSILVDRHSLTVLQVNNNYSIIEMAQEGLTGGQLQLASSWHLAGGWLVE